MKKVLAIFVVACLVLSLFTGVFTAVPSARAETEGDYTYTIDGGSNVTITGYTGAGGAIIIPSSLGGESCDRYWRYRVLWSDDPD